MSEEPRKFWFRSCMQINPKAKIRLGK